MNREKQEVYYSPKIMIIMKANMKLLLMLAIIMVGFTSCSSDDEPKGSPPHRVAIPEQIPVVPLELPESVEAVDLGLSVLWASCNLGASSPKDYGGYFGWGDPTGELWSDAGIGWNENGYTWNSENYGGVKPANNEIGGTDQDVVSTHWGEGWRTPSIEEARELNRECFWVVREADGVKWYEVIGPNGNSIILPLAGIYGDSTEYGDDDTENGHFKEGPFNVNYAGFYWTSSICDRTDNFGPRGYDINPDVIQAWAFRFHTNVKTPIKAPGGMFVNHLRAFHMSIRPVRSK